jgi:hypothetical protein
MWRNQAAAHTNIQLQAAELRPASRANLKYVGPRHLLSDRHSSHHELLQCYRSVPRFEQVAGTVLPRFSLIVRGAIYAFP